MSAPERRIHAVVLGRVQGVNFRSHTASVGRRLGLTGWVRNLDDGSVELEAQGTAYQLRDFLRDVELGPPLARVDAIRCDDRPAIAGEENFVVRR